MSITTSLEALVAGLDRNAGSENLSQCIVQPFAIAS